MAIGSPVTGTAGDSLDFIRVGPGEIAPTVDTTGVRIRLGPQGTSHRDGCSDEEEDVFGKHLD